MYPYTIIAFLSLCSFFVFLYLDVKTLKELGSKNIKDALDIKDVVVSAMFLFLILSAIWTVISLILL